MAGTGYHPEGHVWKPLRPDVSRPQRRERWICANCAEVVADKAKASEECVDDC